MKIKTGLAILITGSMMINRMYRRWLFQVPIWDYPENSKFVMPGDNRISVNSTDRLKRKYRFMGLCCIGFSRVNSLIFSV